MTLPQLSSLGQNDTHSKWYQKKHNMQRLFQKELSPLLVKKYHLLKIEQD
jgi:hypothetical protein